MGFLRPDNMPFPPKPKEYKIGEKIKIEISLENSTRMFEIATERARMMALVRFGSDQSGGLVKVEGYHRSCCSLKIKLEEWEMSGGMGGWSYDFTFKAWCVCHEE